MTKVIYLVIEREEGKQKGWPEYAFSHIEDAEDYRQAQALENPTSSYSLYQIPYKERVL
jgi:hypothetical protein